MATKKDSQKRIIFLHPDLGIGGAERLVIDAAVGLQSLGHKVTIFTSHCDPNHCFTEARDGTLDVRVRGNTVFPPSIFRRLTILFAILRQLHLVLSIAVFSSELKDLAPTDFFIDQLSACVPLIRLLHNEARVLFYCHFPDKLLVKDEAGSIGQAKSWYRVPFDMLESWSTGCADSIVVNSKFTGRVVKHVFATLMLRPLKVVYPCVDTEAAGNAMRTKKSLWPGKRVLLSINRFEKKKDVALAIKAFAGLGADEREGARLVVAGGYDARMDENVMCHKELEALATSLGLQHETFKKVDSPSDVADATSVLFLLSVPDDLKQSLLDSAVLLIYTPRNEHFGIVPLEAMLNKVSVLAANEGGPLETVVEGETGWLRSTADTDSWTEIIRKVLVLRATMPAELMKMGEAGRERVVENFSKRKMALRLDKCLDEMREAERPAMVDVAILTAIGAIFFAVALGVGLMLLLYYTLDKIVDVEPQKNANPPPWA